jgi:nucleoid DNA-binding protein/nucleoid-associated protein YgaU
MNKEIRAEVQRLSGLDKSTCSLLLSGLERVFQEEVIHMTTIKLDGLGLFVPHKHPEYLQDDPASGQVLLYPPRITCRFQPQGETAPGVSVSVPATGVASIERMQLSTLLADYVKLIPEQADAFLQALIQSTISHLQAGEEVMWTNFGTFRIVNFRDGASSRIAWVIDDKMREQINAPFSCFEPVPVGQMEVKPKAPEEGTIDSSESVDTEVDEPLAEAPAEVPEEPQVLSEPEEEPIEALEVTESQNETVEAPEEETPVIVPEAAQEEVPKEPLQESPQETPQEEAEKGQETLNGPAQIVQKQHKSLRKWIFAGIIFLFLIIICNICASLLPTKSEVKQHTEAEEPAVVASAEAPVEESAEDPTEESAEEPNEESAEQPASVPVALPEEISSDSESAAAALTTPAKSTVQMYWLTDDGERRTERVQPGDRLTLMAQRLYGNKAFWVYLYEVNKDQLKSPNNVTAGMNLYLPDPIYWQIDATNDTSVQTALRRAAKLVQ